VLDGRRFEVAFSGLAVATPSSATEGASLTLTTVAVFLSVFVGTTEAVLFPLVMVKGEGFFLLQNC
jgi:hypothetical protein